MHSKLYFKLITYLLTFLLNQHKLNYGVIYFMYKKLHLHSYEDITNKVFRHEHKYSGVTTKNPDFDGHSHYMSGYTEDVRGHVHYFSIISGPNIKVKEGHMHFYRGLTSINKKHYQYIWGYTSIYSDY